MAQQHPPEDPPAQPSKKTRTIEVEVVLAAVLLVASVPMTLIGIGVGMDGLRLIGGCLALAGIFVTAYYMIRH
jgi:hypothetical protein